MRNHIIPLHAKRRGWQTFRIKKRDTRIIRPCVTQHRGRCDLLALHDHDVTFDNRIGPDEFAIRAGNRKALEQFAAHLQALANIRKMQTQR